MIISAKIEQVGGQDCVVLTLPLHDPQPSSTGRSMIVAESSPKFQQVPIEVAGKQLAVLVNAVISNR